VEACPEHTMALASTTSSSLCLNEAIALECMQAVQLRWGEHSLLISSHAHLRTRAHTSQSTTLRAHNGGGGEGGGGGGKGKQ